MAAIRTQCCAVGEAVPLALTVPLGEGGRDSVGRGRRAGAPNLREAAAVA